MIDNTQLNDVATFARDRWINTGHDCMMSDIHLVAALWEKSPTEFRIQGNTSFHQLYNTYAAHKQKEYNRLDKNPIG